MPIARDILHNPTTIGSTLLTVCVDAFGTEFLDWEPETVKPDVERLAGGPIPSTNLDKLMALSIILTSEDFFTRPKAFLAACNALGGEDEPVAFTTFDPPTPEECAWGVFESLLHRPLGREETPDQRFGPKVQQLIAMILEDNGFMFAPRPLDFVPLPEKPSAVTEDDPEMFQAVWGIQNKNAQAITSYVAGRMKALLSQLSELKLSSGNTDDVVKRLSAALR